MFQLFKNKTEKECDAIKALVTFVVEIYLKIKDKLYPSEKKWQLIKAR
jgi:hypothetical protein